MKYRMSLAAGVGVAALFLGLGLALAGRSWLLAAVLATALLPWMLIARSDHLLFAAVVWVYVADWLVYDLGVLPAQATWLFEAILLVLLIRGFAASRKLDALRLPVAGWVYIAVVAASFALSLTLGTSGLLPGLIGVRKYLRIPLLAAVAGGDTVTDAGTSRVWYALVLVGIVQIPAVLRQSVLHGVGDALSGTFGPGGTGLMGLFLTMLACTVMLLPRSLPGRLAPARYAVGTALIAPIVPAGAVFPLYLVPVGLMAGVFALRGASGKVLLRLAVVGLILAALLPAAVSFTQTRGLVGLDKFTSLQGLLRYDREANSSFRLTRLGQLSAANTLVASRGVTGILFGYGPGAASLSTLGSAFTGPLYRKVPWVMWIESSLARGIVEVGYLGVFAGLLLFLWVGRQCALALRDEANTPRGNILLIGCIGAVFMILASPYNDAWTQPGTSIPAWLAAGILSRHKAVAGSEIADDE